MLNWRRLPLKDKMKKNDEVKTKACKTQGTRGKNRKKSVVKQR